MFNIISRLQCLKTCLSSTAISQLNVIVTALLAMTGRVTMLGISRWAGEGGSYRTVQRFFNTPIAWVKVHWCLIRHCFLSPDDVFIMAGDETVVTKSGKITHGIDRFFSSIYEKVVPGLSFFTFSLISTKHRASFPIMIQQNIRSEEKTICTEDLSSTEHSKEDQNRNGPKKKIGRGRPKGSKDKNKENVDLSPYLCFIQSMLKKVLLIIGNRTILTYMVLDGAFGNNNAFQTVKQCGLHLISKLHRNSALYFPYSGKYSGRGRMKKYGDRVDYDNIPKDYLKETTCEESIQTETYQMTLLHKLFAQKLNVVIIVKTNLRTLARSHVILFSSDLDLPYGKLIDYYSLRFQIEFNFRDAKQYWGLEDFMNVKETPITNAANLAFFMVNISHALIDEIRKHNPLFGIQDLKAYFRAGKYLYETLKLIPEKPDPILIQQLFAEITKIGSINTP
ncbi:MAG TPA: transposase [Ignavibacteriaceae bacterium]